MHPIILTLVVAAISPNAAFVQRADADLSGQYALAALAESHAASPQVKALARTIATNAGNGARYLEGYARAHHISLAGKPTFRADIQYGNMSSMHGKAFDSQFVEAIRTDDSFQESDFQSPQVSDPALRRFASRQYQMIERADQRAKRLGG
jgi:hypothetical protein